jgi:glutathione S-transferase
MALLMHYATASAFTQKVRLALRLKKIPYSECFRGNGDGGHWALCDRT